MVDRIKGLFGFGSQSQANSNSQNSQSSKDPLDDEIISLVSDNADSKSHDTSSTAANSAGGVSSGFGVFSKAQEMSEQVQESLQDETRGQDTRYAVIFLVISLLFFLAAIGSLPMVLLMPSTFNLYFCFASLNLQVAFAFWYGPINYLRNKLFCEGKKWFASIYLISLAVCFYFIFTGAGYLYSLIGIGLQGITLMYLITGAMQGNEAANSFMYQMVVGNLANLLKGGNKESGLPL